MTTTSNPKIDLAVLRLARCAQAGMGADAAAIEGLAAAAAHEHQGDAAAAAREIAAYLESAVRMAASAFRVLEPVYAQQVPGGSLLGDLEARISAELDGGA